MQLEAAVELPRLSSGCPRIRPSGIGRAKTVEPVNKRAVLFSRHDQSGRIARPDIGGSGLGILPDMNCWRTCWLIAPHASQCLSRFATSWKLIPRDRLRARGVPARFLYAL